MSLHDQKRFTYQKEAYGGALATIAKFGDVLMHIDNKS